MISRDIFERQSLYLFVLVVAAFCLYAKTFGATWTYDDAVVIVNNPDIKSLSAFLENSYATRPVRELSFLLDYKLFGLNPAGWHFQSILFHGLNACLVFVFLQKLKFDKLVAFFAALIFLVHPIQVEVVANLSHRKDSLALCFGLLACLSYFSALKRVRTTRLLLLFGAVLCYVLAFLSKENMYLLPIVFIVYELLFAERNQRLMTRNAKCSLLGASAVVIALIAYLSKFNLYQRFLTEFSRPLIKVNFFDVSIDAYYRMVVKSIGFLFSKLIWPVDLAIEYVYEVPVNWTDFSIVSVIATFGAYLAVMIWSWRNNPKVFLALLWTIVFYLPTSNLYPVSYFAADRYLYTPSVGVIAVLVYGVVLLSGRYRPVGICVLSLLVVLYSGAAYRQTKVWQSTESLWANALAVSPTSTSAMTYYGLALLQQDKVREALPYLERAAKNFNWPETYYYLAVAYEALGMKNEAIRYFCFFLKSKGPKNEVDPGFVAQHLLDEYGVDCR